MPNLLGATSKHLCLVLVPSFVVGTHEQLRFLDNPFTSLFGGSFVLSEEYVQIAAIERFLLKGGKELIGMVRVGARQGCQYPIGSP
jgi:hypothetical protein